MSELDLVAALLHDYAARHEHIKAVYEKYKRFDEEWKHGMKGYRPTFLREALYDCWQAIRTAMEEQP